MRIFRSYRQEADEELMCKVSRDDNRAFEELYTRYAPRLQGFFIRMLGSDSAKAEDFTQELFIKIYEHRLSYQKERSFSSWIFAMAYNLCKNEYRHKDVVACHEAEINVLPALVEDMPFEQKYDNEVFEAQLKKSLERLSGDQLTAFTLRYDEELTIAQIAEVLQCPEGTVKSRLHYALQTLSQSLSMYNPIKQ